MLKVEKIFYFSNKNYLQFIELQAKFSHGQHIALTSLFAFERTL